ncbi:bifunctional riboflavin kinase/FAD synthetase [Lacibacter sediminis]|uniref:Riboflavin biosynthesis protein n=1 Tax=Lacibacter sediminis TaxID=2760713 RepID=A0A7G5XCM6_9BACT|nr:bifunctional riboflavin kinase/FAD synthetase [Lacibacter sediminis]QNA43229.1 bifunctional riboflavin kinase/FAD synthetase [Lacibacter sediminis]
MKVYRSLQQLPVFTNAVVTIGTFDGVHLGHQQIIRQLCAEAKENGGESVLISFYPHPRKIVQPERYIPELTTLEERIELLKQQGLDNLVVVPFNKEFSQQTAQQYIKNFLVDRFHPSLIIIGYDHKFGNNREGDYRLLEKMGEEYQYSVKEIPQQLRNEVIVSSTKIREAIAIGDVEKANQLLGYSYFFRGYVVEGNKLGRKLGYPTANLQIQDADKLVPANGVYAVQAQIEGESGILKGMMNIGTRPTVDGTTKTVEVNLFDFEEDIYNRHLKVFVKYHLRNEVKFDGLDKLIEQLHKDKEISISKLADN